MSVTIQFLGGAGTVTGSKYLVENGSHKVLIDCGLFQGIKELRLQNWAPLPIHAAEIDAVILTHAHLDHCGYLPLLVKQGFQGKIFSTSPTRDLSKIILLDSAKIQEEDAKEANQQGYTKHSPAKPLYDTQDVNVAMKLFVPVKSDEWTPLFPTSRFRFKPSGHILGSALIELEFDGIKIVFSGDLGRMNPLLYPSPAVIEQADYLLIESTYGDRLHDQASPLEQLAQITRDTVSRKGHLLIPSFAVGRTQDLLYLFSILKKEGKIPDVPIYLDTPMGINATEIFVDHPLWHKLSSEELGELSRVATLVKSRALSSELLKRKPSSIIIAGSGMVSGGRILQHLATRLPDDRNTVLLVGYQATGTRGRLLSEGASELKIHGQYVPIKARVEEITGLSAHADQFEILNWLGKITCAPKTTFIVHGEPQASDTLRVKIKDKLSWNVSIPRYLEKITLEPSTYVETQTGLHGPIRPNLS
ncbi:MAG: MBL fold metallo-hydrolase [Bdellovibrionia bacterium]